MTTLSSKPSPTLTAVESRETTPLLTDGADKPVAKPSLLPPIRRVFIMAYCLALSFGFTQTSLIYAFRLMTCEEYYKTHEWSGLGDRCAIPTVEASTARNVAIMSSTTTGSSESNLHAGS